MSELDIRMVLEEIEAWKNGERGSKLTWDKLERMFPFTRQTMYSKIQIRNSFCEMKSLKGIRTRMDAPYEIEILRLKERIKELESQLSHLQRIWIEKKL